MPLTPRGDNTPSSPSGRPERPKRPAPKPSTGSANLFKGNKIPDPDSDPRFMDQLNERAEQMGLDLGGEEGMKNVSDRLKESHTLVNELMEHYRELTKHPDDRTKVEAFGNALLAVAQGDPHRAASVMAAGIAAMYVVEEFGRRLDKRNDDKKDGI